MFFAVAGDHTLGCNFLNPLCNQVYVVALDVKPEAFTTFNQYMKRGMKGTAWTSGCQSWYLDADGDPVVWPYTWDRWVTEMKAPAMDDFVPLNCEAPTGHS